jgi:hypothetical protein
VSLAFFRSLALLNVTHADNTQLTCSRRLRGSEKKENGALDTPQQAIRSVSCIPFGEVPKSFAFKWLLGNVLACLVFFVMR